MLLSASRPHDSTSRLDVRAARRRAARVRSTAREALALSSRLARSGDDDERRRVLQAYVSDAA